MAAHRLGLKLAFPAIATLYALLALHEMWSGDYMDVTIRYSFVIGLPVLLLAGVQAASELLTFREGAEDNEDSVAAVNWPAVRRVLLVAGLTAGAIVAMPTIGYMASFGGLAVLLMLSMRVRNPLAILLVALAIVAVVHFVFVGVLNLALPTGPWLAAE